MEGQVFEPEPLRLFRRFWQRSVGTEVAFQNEESGSCSWREGKGEARRPVGKLLSGLGLIRRLGLALVWKAVVWRSLHASSE